MPFIHCCSAKRKCKSYILEPQEGYVFSQMLYLEECPVCSHTKIKVLRVTPDATVNSFEKKNQKARSLFERLKGIIRFEEKQRFDPLNSHSKYFLNYTDRGTVKKCYSNLASIQSGIFDPYEGLKAIEFNQKYLQRPAQGNI